MSIKVRLEVIRNQGSLKVTKIFLKGSNPICNAGELYFVKIFELHLNPFKFSPNLFHLHANRWGAQAS